jgi:hypothetical protein
MDYIFVTVTFLCGFFVFWKIYSVSWNFQALLITVMTYLHIVPLYESMGFIKQFFFCHQNSLLSNGLLFCEPN